MAEVEKPDEERNRKLKELEEKNVAHYSALLSAYLLSRSEVNKAIFVFSASAIGLLFALAEEIKGESACLVSLYLAATFFFVAALLSSLFISAANSKQLESYLRDRNEDEKKYKLNQYARINYFAFGFGVLALVFALSAYVTKSII